MNKIKIVAVDLDGTVLDSEKEISIENQKAFRKCREHGIYVVPVTGRPVSGLYDEYIKAMGCDYSINTNGAVVVDLKNNKELINNTLSAETANSVLDVLDKYDCYCSIFYKGHGYLTEKDYNSELKKHAGTPLSEYIEITRRKVENQRYFLNRNGYCDNIYVTASNTEIRDQIMDSLKNIDNIFYTCSDVDDVEIGGNCSKGKTLLSLASLLSVNKEEILAIGDSGNDVSMLEVAGISVAMGNGSEVVKNTADFITGTCEENGVATAIEKFCFNQ